MTDLVKSVAREPAQELPLIPFMLLSVPIGALAGLGAVAFRNLIGLIHNLLFLRRFSCAYDANAYTPAGPWGPFIVLVPVLGALGVVFLVKMFAPEAKGHGVPEVMDAVYHNKGIIRPVVALIKALASALCIGSGGSVGREGPIVQIGASLGSTLGQVLPMAAWQRSALVAAGAGGGIAATFNTPIGGVLFAVELMLLEVSHRTLVTVAIATATATYIGRVFFGPHPSFIIPAFETPFFQLTNPWLLAAYAALGVAIALASTLFIRAIYGVEDLLEKYWFSNYFLRHATAMLVVGGVMYALLAGTGHYYVEGVGYAAIQDILTGGLAAGRFLLILFALKLLVTSLTLGSGGSGGIFSPSLFLGATLGAAYGLFLGHLFPELGISAPAMAVAGMGGVVGGVTGAPLTAIVMIFEMTRDYGVIVPMTVTVALGYGVRKFLCRESIYTLKIARRGHGVPDALRAEIEQLERAKDIMETRIGVLSASATLRESSRAILNPEEVRWFLVEDGGRVAAVLREDEPARALTRQGADTRIGSLGTVRFIRVGPDLTLPELLARMRRNDASCAVVVRDGVSERAHDVLGVIAGPQIAEAVERDAGALYE